MFFQLCRQRRQRLQNQQGHRSFLDKTTKFDKMSQTQWLPLESNPDVHLVKVMFLCTGLISANFCKRLSTNIFENWALDQTLNAPTFLDSIRNR